DLTVKSLNVSDLVRDLPGFPVRITGEMSGTLDGKLSEAKPNGEREFSSRLNLDAPKLKVQNVPVERLKARVGYRRGVVRYRLEGDALGGRFDIDGRWPAAPRPAGEEAPPPRRSEAPGGEEGQEALALRQKQPAEEDLRLPANTEGTIRVRRAQLGRL